MSASKRNRRHKIPDTWEIPPDWRPGCLVGKRRFVQARAGAGLTLAQKLALVDAKSKSGAPQAELIRRALAAIGIVAHDEDDDRPRPPAMGGPVPTRR